MYRQTIISKLRHELAQSATINESDLLRHIDYLNQKQYIEAEFEGNAYAKQDDVPDAFNPQEVEGVRVANTLGQKMDPYLIEFASNKLN